MSAPPSGLLAPFLKRFPLWVSQGLPLLSHLNASQSGHLLTLSPHLLLLSPFLIQVKPGDHRSYSSSLWSTAGLHLLLFFPSQNNPKAKPRREGSRNIKHHSVWKDYFVKTYKRRFLFWKMLLVNRSIWKCSRGIIQASAQTSYSQGVLPCPPRQN